MRNSDLPKRSWMTRSSFGKISGSPSPASTWRLNKRQAPSSVARLLSRSAIGSGLPSEGWPSVTCKTVGGKAAGCASRHCSRIPIAALSPAHIAVLPWLRGSNQMGNRTDCSTTSQFGPATCEARDGVQCLTVQRSLKAVAGLLPAIGDHPHVKVVADTFGLGATGNERVERLIEHIRQKGGLALSAFQPMIHRRGLVHHHHDGGRRRAADFCLVTQGSPPRVAATATCNNGDLHAANGLNAVRCSARQATRFPHRSSTCSRPFVIFCKARDKARDMQHFCDRGAASYHK